MLCTYNVFLIHSSDERSTRWVHSLAMINSAMVNTDRQRLLLLADVDSLGYTHSRGTTGACGSFIFSFTNNLHTHSHRGFINLPSHPWCVSSFPSSPHPLYPLAPMTGICCFCCLFVCFLSESESSHFNFSSSLNKGSFYENRVWVGVVPNPWSGRKPSCAEKKVLKFLPIHECMCAWDYRV